MGVVRYIGDSLRNLVANLGTGRDKAAHTHYDVPVLTDPEASNAYRGAWLPKKIVDIPALDACRNWRSWQADEQQISALEKEETRLGVQTKVREAQIKARLFGGAAIYIGTGDEKSAEPLDPTKISAGGIRNLTVLTRRVLTANERETDPESPYYGRPKSYTLSTQQAGQVTIHPSRLVVFIGAEHPDPEIATGADAGWGDSVLLSIMQVIKSADGTAANVASLVFEANVDVIKIPGFMQGLAGGGDYEKQILDRLTLAAMAKGINGTLILDGEEDYQKKSASFAELANLIMTFMQLVSGAADIPITRLLGQSPGGLNASGDNDIRNYYDRIRSMQELSMTPAMAILDECLIRSALGTRPPEIFYNWRSLWQTSDKERADIGKIVAETIKTVDETGLIPDAVMSKVAQNMLVEAGVAPGLESEMDEWLKANPEGQQPPDDDEEAAAALAIGAVTDAAPRTLYVHRKVTNASAIIAWAKEQGFATTLPAEDLHVTIAFSRDPVDWMKVGRAWSEDEQGRLRVRPGGARMVSQFEGGAVVLQFSSDELEWRHQQIRDAGASWDWPEYQPHVTLTYDAGDVDLSQVTPYTGPIELGPEVFEELDEDWKSKVQEK